MNKQSADIHDHRVNLIENRVPDVVKGGGDLNSDVHEVEGYVTCKNMGCGSLVVKQVARRTFGFCEICARNLLGKSVRVAEVVNAGRRSYVPLKNRKTEKSKYPDTEKRAEKARNRAMKRLRALFPEIYDILLAEERSKEGLNPWSIERAVDQAGEEPSKATLDFANVYAALSQQGVDIYGLEKDEARKDIT